MATEESRHRHVYVYAYICVIIYMCINECLHTMYIYQHIQELLSMATEESRHRQEICLIATVASRYT
jgi:hypothetical protein